MYGKICAPSLVGSERLADLERRYDGPIPEAERRFCFNDPGTKIERRRAETETAFLATLVRRQIRAIRRRRLAGGMHSDLLADLACYRRQRRAWQRFAASLQDGEAPPAEGGASNRWLDHHPIHDRV
jgi:hypothetical protein